MKNLTVQLVTFVIFAICGLMIVCTPEPKTTENYPISTVIIELRVEDDIVVAKDFNGNLWQFYGCEDWANGDICAMIVNDCGTDEIYDDEILSTRYCGYID